MPFGHNCEHPNFDSCVRTMTGKVDKPLAFCASLMRATEEKCRQRSRAEQRRALSVLEILRLKRAGAFKGIDLSKWKPMTENGWLCYDRRDS